MKLDEETQREIGKRLREQREMQDLTQEEVAKKAKITTSYYARIERGKENPSLVVLKLLVKTLKIKSSDILPF